MANLLQFPRQADETQLTNLVRLPARESTPSTGFYASNDAARLAQIPRHRLDAWKRDEIIQPTLTASLNGDEEHGYTFEEVVLLRLVRILRESKLSLIRAVETVKSIRERFGAPGPKRAEIRIYRTRRLVFVYRGDEWEFTVGSSDQPPVRRGQRAFPELLLGNDEFSPMKDRVDALLIPSEYLAAVEIDPQARNGLPIIRGTTITTGLIYALRKQGWTATAIQESYPHLKPAQIKAAINFEIYLDKQSLAA
jgi:uncharacterized protein (DUF433 family)